MRLPGQAEFPQPAAEPIEINQPHGVLVLNDHPQHASIGAEASGKDLASRGRRDSQQLFRGRADQFPEPHSPVSRGGRQDLAPGMKRDGVDGIGMREDFGNERTGRRPEKRDSPFHQAAGDQRIVRSTRTRELTTTRPLPH